MKRFLTTVLALLAVSGLPAEPSDLDWGLAGVRFNWFIVPTGADLRLRWHDLSLVAGGGYEAWDWGRDLATGDPKALSAPYDTITIPNGQIVGTQTFHFGELALRWGAGLSGNTDLGTASHAFPDFAGNVFAFGRTSATLDQVVRNAHGVPSGTLVESLAEWGPGALSVRHTDYYKLAFRSSWFLPLWDLDGPTHLWSGTLAFRANAQWIDGASVPVLLLEPTQVRGYRGLLDTRFRSVATGELRIGFPSLYGVHDLVPLILFFGEGGWYAGYADSSSASDRSGWLASAGGGLGLLFFNVLSPTLTVAKPLVGDETALWWKINFNLRF